MYNAYNVKLYKSSCQLNYNDVTILIYKRECDYITL